ncbi:taste receptor type 2 member 14-like [Peromyscus californicus insignis]|uniref:taste receptor type 2 member 14-like n=1 Tax=Peromyscus californicus insignis TaxID=564181 RepID=UPI0022A78960|nr:taste receptor type 2 member 14-like [Peromyscus californicus insignis]
MGVMLIITLTIVFIMEFIVGSLGNGFIAVVNIVDCVKRRNISSVDQILTALAVSRISVLWVVFIDWCFFAVYPASLITGCIIRIMYISWTVTNHFSIWLATSLSIFYFFKIAVFSNSMFLYLKWRFKKVVSVAMLLSLFLLFLNILMINTHINTVINESRRNASYTFIERTYPQFFRFLLFPSFIFTFIPFIVSLTAFLLLIFSLWRHLKNMQHNTKGCRDISTTAHIKALKMVVVFLMLYICFFLSIVAIVWASELENIQITLFAKATLTTFPAVHSCVQILGHSKLRQALRSVLQWVRFRSDKRSLHP